MNFMGLNSLKYYKEIAVAAATTATLGGCAAKTPEVKCQEVMGQNWITAGEKQCGGVSDPRVAEYCQRRFQEAIDALLSACVTVTTGNGQDCRYDNAQQRVECDKSAEDTSDK